MMKRRTIRSLRTLQKSTCGTTLLVLVVSGCKCDNGVAGGTHLDAAQGRDGNPQTDGDGALSDGSSANVDAGSSMHVASCPGCPCFPGTDCTGNGQDAGAPPACTAAGQAPTLVYPPDQVLLPPNTNVLEVQFEPGAGNTLFEIDFANASTDVRLATRCNAITDTRGNPTGGCGFTLDMTNWRWVADVNRGGDPVHVTIRATPDGTCVGKSATRDISFATEDLVGAIYYWQSVTVGGVPGKAGGIYRYDFGREDIAPEPFLESSPATGNRCVGCHFMSRDGLRMTYGSDDPDSDDEYGDLSSRLLDVNSRTVLSSMIVPGFRTFTHDHAVMLASDGRGRANPPAFERYSGETGLLLDSISSGPMRGTQPDWAPDDSRVVFVRPAAFLQNHGGTSPMMGDDGHFIGGSLYAVTSNGATFGAPAAIVQSQGENNYYPAFSPDGAFIIFDRVSATTGTAADAFANPNARIYAVSAQGGSPVDLARLNQGNGLSNSWPRWSPYVQHDRGHTILWVTFSSVRDYGVRVRNQMANGVFCYPPESPENQNMSHQCPLVPASCGCTATSCPDFCVQPQIWMAAVEIDANGGISAGRDTSHPAFWLPFQAIEAHNHIAQWVTGIPGHPPPQDGGDGSVASDASVEDTGVAPDAGTCGTPGAACGSGLPLCCSAVVCVSNVCSGL